MLSRLVCFLLLFSACAVLPVHAGDKEEKPVNLEKLNSAGDEIDPHLVNATSLLYVAPNSDGKLEVRLSKRASAASAWQPGKLFRPYLSSKEYDCRTPFVFKG